MELWFTRKSRTMNMQKIGSKLRSFCGGCNRVSTFEVVVKGAALCCTCWTTKERGEAKGAWKKGKAKQ